jgi:methionine-rich copper-binding protein CopC
MLITQFLQENIMHITRTFKSLGHSLLALALTCFTAHAFAHAGLENSIPAANSHVKMSPPDVILTYEKPVMLMGLTVTDDKGKAIDIAFKAASDMQLIHKQVLPRLSKGIYTVNWAAMGKDGHNVKGAFTFSVGAEAKLDPAKTQPTTKDQSSMDMNHSGHAK